MSTPGCFFDGLLYLLKVATLAAPNLRHAVPTEDFVQFVGVHDNSVGHLGSSDVPAFALPASNCWDAKQGMNEKWDIYQD